MRIGALAHRTGVSERLLRYYEAQGPDPIDGEIRRLQSSQRAIGTMLTAARQDPWT